MGIERMDEIALGPLAFQTVATPGHTSGSTCFYEPRLRLLIAASAAVAAAVTAALDPAPEPSTYEP